MDVKTLQTIKRSNRAPLFIMFSIFVFLQIFLFALMWRSDISKYEQYKYEYEQTKVSVQAKIVKKQCLYRTNIITYEFMLNGKSRQSFGQACAMRCDDIAVGANESLEVLEKNPDIARCSGYYAGRPVLSHTSSIIYGIVFLLLSISVYNNQIKPNI